MKRICVIRAVVLLKDWSLPVMKALHTLLLPPVLGAGSSAVIALQIAGALDLSGLAVSIWALWTAISLPLGGKLQRAFHLIGFGTVAFAASHVLDLLLAGFGVLPGNTGFVVTQGTVLASMLIFVPGLAALADVLPTLPSASLRAPFPRIWPVFMGLTISIGGLCFIAYGLTPESEIITLIGLDSALLLTAVLCVFLLLRARIGGAIGRSLWLALAGLLIFSLAHPLQIWLVEETTLPAPTLAVLHRLIVMPALILFVLSISRVARALNSPQAALPAPRSATDGSPEPERTVVSALANQQQNESGLQS
jgi:hypothetical protein